MCTYMSVCDFVFCLHSMLSVQIEFQSIHSIANVYM